MTASNGGGGSVSPPGPGAVYHGYDSGHSTSHSPNEDAIAVAANSAKSSVLSREAANKLGEFGLPNLPSYSNKGYRTVFPGEENFASRFCIAFIAQ